MRVLWFTNSPCNYQSAQKRYGYNGGGWMSALLNEIQKKKGLDIAICFIKGNEPEKIEQNDVTYYPIPPHKTSLKHKILAATHPNDIKYDKVHWAHYLKHFDKITKDFQPDIIEVFGSELYTGLASLLTDYPRVLHLQGILSAYYYVYHPFGVSPLLDCFQDFNITNIYKRKQYLNYWKRSCQREEIIFSNIEHVIGRTTWDQAVTTALNPKAKYHYGGEMLRSIFYEKHHRIIPKKLTIVTTSSSAMYKGFDFILKTANILKNKFSLDFTWQVYGNINPQFFEKFTGLQHQHLNIQLGGVATADQLCNAICNSTVYFQPSYIENSPNSVCEAQILGVPVVATNVGGTASLIENNVSGVLVPIGDPYFAAYQIYRIYNDNSLNLSIGEKAKQTAHKRHNREIIANQLLNTYKEIIEEFILKPEDNG